MLVNVNFAVIIGLRTDIRKKIGKVPGDIVTVTISEREKNTGKKTDIVLHCIKYTAYNALSAVL